MSRGVKNDVMKTNQLPTKTRVATVTLVLLLATFSVFADDTNAPIIACPTNLTVKTANFAGTAVNFTVTASEDSGPPMVICTPASGFVFYPGSTLVHCVAQDLAGHAATNAFNVLVEMDHAPLFVGLTVSSVKNQSAEVLLSKILSRATDEDFDPVTVSAVSALSQQGGAVELAPAVLHYTPPLDFVGTDLITFTLHDGHCGQTAATLPVTVISQPAVLNQLQIAAVPGGFFLYFLGVPGRAYEVQRTTDFTNWMTLATFPADEEGSIKHTDTNAPPVAAFYRTLAP